MVRPEFTYVGESESWNELLDDNIGILKTMPLPPAEFSAYSDLPTAVSYDRCLAATQDGRYWVSHRGAWHELRADKRQVVQVATKDPGLTTFSAVGMPAPTVDGGSSDGDHLAGPFLIHSTGTTPGNTAGLLSSSYSQTRRVWRPRFETLLRVGGTVTQMRLWAGLFSADPSSSSGTGALHLAAFRYATDVDGTAFWRCVTADGASATVTTTTAAFASSSDYLLELELDADADTPSEVRFYVNKALVATHGVASDNPPGNTTFLGWQNRLTTLDTADKQVRTSFVRTERRHVA